MGSGYTFRVTPITDGALTVDILSGVGRDLAGNNNLSASTLNLLADVTAPIIVEVTPVLSLTNDNTPNYTFSSTETGTISYSGACTSTTTTATPGNNTITLASLGDDIYTDCTIKVRDAAMNTSNIVTLTSFTIDTTVPTATLVYTPNISTSGSVIATLTGASEVITITNNSGASTKTFSSNGTFTFLFSDLAGNTGSRLATVSTIDTIAPIIVEVTPVLMLTRNNTPSYTFSSTETGTISYSGACTSTTTTATPGNNTITLASLGDDIYTDCTIKVRDAAMNTSNIVTLTSFTIDTTVPTATLVYTPNISTSGSVIATLTGASEVITITNNSGASTKTFSSNGTFTFLFSDLAGNTGSRIATVSTIDTIAPVVTLSGASTVNIAFASVYTDAGARWIDVVDGSGTLTASGTVNTGVAGTYILVYTKTDVAGNTGTGSRSVIVAAAPGGGGGGGG